MLDKSPCLTSILRSDNNYVYHECIYVTRSGCGNPKIFRCTLCASGWTPLSKFLNPPLVTTNVLIPILAYHMAGKFDREFNLVVWQIQRRHCQNSTDINLIFVRCGLLCCLRMALLIHFAWELSVFSNFSFEHSRTPSGKETVTGVQVVTASQVQSIGVGGRPFRPAHNRPLNRSSRGTYLQVHGEQAVRS